MLSRAKGLWVNFSSSLGFLPALMIIVFAALGIELVEVDRALDINSGRLIFGGDGPAARTVLSVIAGSLITVAGLTFSITMVVLQLASSQFSPRALRTLFADRITQVTIGTYVGTFVYAILVLRAVGSFGDTAFVPRISITLASLLGIAAVVLLVLFLHHVSQLIQVSYVTARIARETLARTRALYPETYGGAPESAEALLASWRLQEPGRVMGRRPGYVQWIDVKGFGHGLEDGAERVAVLVRPGDFVSVEMPIAEVWPAEAAESCGHQLADMVSIANERDLDQDVDFGLRQLADTAMKAMSTGINDPMTAITCISYMRSILVRLTEHVGPSAVHRHPQQGLTVILLQRGFDEYLDSMLQINRYLAGDVWVAGKMLEALASCAEIAERCGAEERLRSIRHVAETVAAQAAEEAKSDDDREMIERLADDLGVSVAA